MKINKVSHRQFKETMDALVTLGDRYEQNIDVKDSYEDYDCFISEDGYSGYAVHREDFELVNVFSIVKGVGKDLIADAKQRYSILHLDCFHGYLSKFYADCGFVVEKTEPNWTLGEPDVVFMFKG